MANMNPYMDVIPLGELGERGARQWQVYLQRPRVLSKWVSPCESSHSFIDSKRRPEDLNHSEPSLGVCLFLLDSSTFHMMSSPNVSSANHHHHDFPFPPDFLQCSTVPHPESVRVRLPCPPGGVAAASSRPAALSLRGQENLYGDHSQKTVDCLSGKAGDRWTEIAEMGADGGSVRHCAWRVEVGVTR